MQKQVIIALILMLSIFVVMGCSSDDETEDSKADDTVPVGPTTIAVEEEWPQTVILLLVWMI